jgi:uncharacterized protein (TIGR03118 family)
MRKLVVFALALAWGGCDPWETKEVTAEPVQNSEKDVAPCDCDAGIRDAKDAPLAFKEPAVVEQVNIVSDQADAGAAATDPDLVNAWGLAFSRKGVASISANGTGLAPAYDSSGNVNIKVTVPPADGQPASAPTGQVFNDEATNFGGDVFVFASEDGTLSGWQPTAGSTAVLRVDNSGTSAVYKGLTSGKLAGQARLFAADFHNAKIDVFDRQYKAVIDHHGFVDCQLPEGFAPFNLLVRDDLLFVTYALQDEAGKDDVKGAGNGFVDVFDLEGRLLDRLITQGVLNSPWGLAFVSRSGASCKASSPCSKNEKFKLLVGNFGDGRVNVFTVVRQGLDMNASTIGPIVDAATGQPLVIDGLWALSFGPGAGGFAAEDLFFTAGLAEEQHGLFGKLIFR